MSLVDPPPQRVAEIDGLRGLAIGLVLLAHYVVGVESPWQGPLTEWFGLFYTGVDLFFVLSGFLIGGILLNTRTREHYFRNFFIRRFVRIVPLYAVLLASYELLNAFTQDSLIRSQIESTVPLWVYVTFLQNLWVSRPNINGCAYLNVTWSLAVEEQFYWTLPFVVRYLNVRRLQRLLIAVILISPLVRLTMPIFGTPWLSRWISHNSAPVFDLTVCRADQLALGVLIAILHARLDLRSWLQPHRRLLWVITLFCLVLAWQMDQLGFFDRVTALRFTFIGLFYIGLLLIAMTDSNGLAGRFFRLKWLRRMGLLCYGLYLLHMPVAGILYALMLHSAPNLQSPYAAGVGLLALLVTAGLAELSWRALEMPLIAWSHRLTPSSSSKKLIRQND